MCNFYMVKSELLSEKCVPSVALLKPCWSHLSWDPSPFCLPICLDSNPSELEVNWWPSTVLFPGWFASLKRASIWVCNDPIVLNDQASVSWPRGTTNHFDTAHFLGETLLTCRFFAFRPRSSFSGSFAIGSRSAALRDGASHASFGWHSSYLG